jgi:hypothetical protein
VRKGYPIILDRLRWLRYTDASLEQLQDRYHATNDEWYEKTRNTSDGRRQVAMTLWLALVDDDPDLTVEGLESILARFFSRPVIWQCRKWIAVCLIRPLQIRAARDYAASKGANLFVNGEKYHER